MKKIKSILPLCLLATFALVGCDTKVETPKQDNTQTQENQDNNQTNPDNSGNGSNENGNNSSENSNGSGENGGTVAHEHTWGNPTYSWSEDYTSCTAERVCTADSTHKETETKNSTYTVTTAPTEEEGGAGRYTVNFDNAAFATQTYDVRLAPLPHTHTLSKIEAVESTFFYQGNVEYYHCAGCGKNFDANNKELTDVSLPLLDTDLSLGVNGASVGDFIRTDKPNNYIEWKISNVSLKKDDAITVMPRGNTDKTLSYHPDTNSNITEERKVHNDVDNGEVIIEGNPNGLYLSVSGFKYDGIVIKINNTVYPMNHVTYYGTDKQTYIYGYAYINQNDVVTVIDNDTNTVYDFDDLDDDTTWNTYDFHKGTNDEVVFDYQARYGFEFDRGGNKKLSITKAFAPNAVSSLSVNFDSERPAITMEDNLVAKGTQTYEETMWYITHDCIINKDDVLASVEANGLHIYTASVQLSVNERFNLKDETNSKVIKADHLVYLLINNPSDAIVIDGDYIKALKDVKAEIVYTACLDDIHIFQGTTITPTSGVTMMMNGSFLSMSVDSNNIATYSNLTVNKGDYVVFTDASYNAFTVTLDPSISSSIWYKTDVGTMTMVYFDRAGTFNIKLDVTTKVVSLDIISVEEENITEFTDGYMNFRKNGGYTKLIQNPDNENEMCALNISFTNLEGYIAVTDLNYNPCIVKIASDSSDYLTTTGGQIVYVKQAGTYNFYLNKKTLEIRAIKLS